MNRLRTTSLVATLMVLGGSAISLGQTLLYNHGQPTSAQPTIATGSSTASGNAAPAGGLWSELQSAGPNQANAIAGVRAFGPYRVAQQFTVPRGQSWRIDALRVFAYQPSASTITSPFNGLNVRVWNGQPGEAASTIIGGDATKNVFAASTFTNVYRTFATAVEGSIQRPDRSRAIWQIDSQPLSIVLPAGTYWMDWQVTSSRGSRSAFVPTVTSPGPRSLESAGSLQLVPTEFAHAWIPIADRGIGLAGQPIAQDLPFQLIGDLIPTSIADIAGVGDARHQDGQVDAEDLIAFQLAFFNGDPLADFVGQGVDNSQPDGTVGESDLAAFLEAYARGNE